MLDPGRAAPLADGDTPESISAAIWGPAQRNLTIGLILTVSMAAFEALAVATVLPAAVRDIGGLDWYGWVFSGFMLANLVSITTTGRAADRQGVARPFTLGSGLFVIGLLGAGMAPAMPMVVASRIAQGLGAGAISSVAYVAIARGYPPAARPRMLAMLSSAWVVPGLIGPALAGAVADMVSWRWVFLGLAPPTVLASALAVPSLRRLGPSAAAATASRQTLTALCLAAGVGAALFGLGCGELYLAIAMVGIGSAIAVPALVRLLPAGTLRAAHGLPAAVATVGLLGFGFFGAEAFLPLSLIQVRGQSTMVAGLALTAATVMWTAGAWIQARLAAGGSRRRVAVCGLLLIIVGIAGIALVVMTTVPVAIAAIAWGAAGLGIGLAFSSATLVVLESAPPGQEGKWSAAAQLSNVLGTAMGTGVGGAIVALAAAAPTNSTRTGIALVDACAIAATMIGLLTARGLPAAGPRR
jgi:MFS family permease